MSERTRVTTDPAFEVEIPVGWTAEPDEEGGISISSPEGAGLLHVIAFAQPGDEMLDPAEELYAFLEDQGIELEEDEVEDVELPGGEELSLCEYLAEDDEEGEEPETTYWMVGVATAPGNLVFCSYSCPAEAEADEGPAVREILTSLRLREPPGAG